MKQIPHDAKLVQVIYDTRTGLLAFFSDGTVAEAKFTQRGTRTWHLKENIYTDTCQNAQSIHDPVLAAVYEDYRHDAEIAQYDNDPSPYDGTYSEE